MNVVRFYHQMADDKLKFAVIAMRCQNGWVFVQHKQRATWELPGGHREAGETIEECALRELYEETGISNMRLTPVCVYGVQGRTRVNQSGEESYGMLYRGSCQNLPTLPESEIAKTAIFPLSALPKAWTYREIQPKLLYQCLRSQLSFHIAQEEDSEHIRTILQSLPDWFGIPEALEEYVRESQHHTRILCYEETQVIGFLVLKKTSPKAMELYVLGILPQYHRMGIGRMLMKQAEDIALSQGITYLHVKTLALQANNEAYLKTYAFYEACGFTPLEVLPLWDEHNPCQLLIKKIA